MIHFKKLGDAPHIGLNITVGDTWRRPWVSFSWVWFTPKTHMLSVRRLRIRPYMSPRILTSSHKGSVVDDWLGMRGMVAVQREIIEDAMPTLLADSNAGYPSNGAELPVLHQPAGY